MEVEAIRWGLTAWIWEMPGDSALEFLSAENSIISKVCPLWAKARSEPTLLRYISFLWLS